MAKLENLPRPGLPNSLGAYMEAFKDSVMPPRFTDYVREHLSARLPMHADNQVGILIGGFVLLDVADIRPCLDTLEVALASELPPVTRQDYEHLRTGLRNLISTKLE